MKKTARTALVSLSPGCIMPYSLDTFMDTSSMRGNCTSMLSISRKCIRSLMVRSHAIWLDSPSTESPTSWQLSSSNSFCILPKVMNSEVQTGVKSAGWLNRIIQRPL